jgi:hypothetical protein
MVRGSCCSSRPEYGRHVDPYGEPEAGRGGALAAAWEDPDLDPTQPDFYLAGVIEIPKPHGRPAICFPWR